MITALFLLALFESPGSRVPAAQETSRESELLRSVPCVARCCGGAAAIRKSADGCARGDMVNLLRQLAGPRAVTCGDVRYGQDRSAALTCVEQRLKNNNSPFFVVLDVQGIDSSVAIGVVRTAEGALRMLDWDSDTSGGGGGCEPRHPAILFRECARIEIDQSQEGGIPWDPFKCVESGP